MKKQCVILMGLFFFIFTSCGDEFKEIHDAAKTSTEFVLGRVEFQATQFKLKAYNNQYHEAETVVWQPNPCGVDQQSAGVLIYDACKKEISELNKTAKKQFLFLCKVATNEYQFNWLFKNKTNAEDEPIAPYKSVALALWKNKYFEPDSDWNKFMLESGAVKEMYKKK